MLNWIKNIFKKKEATKKNKEFTDKQLAFLKEQYKKKMKYVSDESRKRLKETKKRADDINSVCPKCKSKNVNDRIKRFEGEIEGKSSGYGWSALSFGESYSSGSIHGKFDTNEVNKCNECHHEWKKEEDKFYDSERNILDYELRCIRYFLSGLKTAKNEIKWDKNDLKEKFNSLEEKKEDAMKNAIDGTWSRSSIHYWSEYPIELIDKIAEEIYCEGSMYRKVWEDDYDIDALKNILKLRSMDEFLIN